MGEGASQGERGVGEGASQGERVNRSESSGGCVGRCILCAYPVVVKRVQRRWPTCSAGTVDWQ